MWSVENGVEESGVENVDPTFPQNSGILAKVAQNLCPHLIFSVYNDLDDLLGFPRSYYYYYYLY